MLVVVVWGASLLATPAEESAEPAVAPEVAEKPPHVAAPSPEPKPHVSQEKETKSEKGHEKKRKRGRD